MRNIFLRAFEPEDYLTINKWRNDPKVQEKTCGHFRYVSTQMEKAWVTDKMMNNSKDIYLAICLNDDSKQMVGYTSLNDIDHVNRKVHWGGIVIDDNFQDGSILIDTFLLVAQHAFDNLGIHRLTGRCLDHHVNSRCMMEMFGFKLDGIERESVYKLHQYHNVCFYSILEGEYYDLLSSDGYSELAIAKRSKASMKNLLKQ